MVRGKEYELSHEEFRALLDLYMVSDPWPLDSDSQDSLRGLLTDEANARGYDSWSEAYHDFEV